MRTEWNTFNSGVWEREINVRDFIQKNYTPYDGDDAFLEGPTKNTEDLWAQVMELSAKERDEEVTLDICLDKDEGIIMGTGGNARNYAAQVVIPARRYEDQDSGERNEEGEPIMVPVPLPFEMERCTLILWGLED